MDYISIEIKCSAELSDILLAELSELGFDSFLEKEEGLEASCPKDIFDKEQTEATFTRYQSLFDFSYAYNEVSKVNWNQEWEKNYDPIFVDNDIYVRATFHAPRPEFTYEIVIDPKMSFGTGHHATTSMMLTNQLLIDHKDKAVLDAGTGTGILAIMASMLGAKSVIANDIDEWCIGNSAENIALNHVGNLEVRLGATPALAFSVEEFDIVLANINKNVLLEEIPTYAHILKKMGILVLSGFYEGDLQDIENCARQVGLTLLSYKTKNNWCSPVFRKD